MFQFSGHKFRYMQSIKLSNYCSSKNIDSWQHNKSFPILSVDIKICRSRVLAPLVQYTLAKTIVNISTILLLISEIIRIKLYYSLMNYLQQFCSSCIPN